MPAFNFATHFKKYREVPTHFAELMLDRELFQYYDSLTKEEQQTFKAQFNAFLRSESERIRGELREIEDSIAK